MCFIRGFRVGEEVVQRVSGMFTVREVDGRESFGDVRGSSQYLDGRVLSIKDVRGFCGQGFRLWSSGEWLGGVDLGFVIWVERR